MADEPRPMPALAQKRRTAVYKAPSRAFTELGVTGLRQYGGFIAEEWLRQLTGQGHASRVWREMADNDATVGALLFAVEMLARGVEWTVEEGSRPEDAEFVEECMGDMSGTWEDFISEVLTMLTFGWEYSEIVYKRRQGPEPRGKGPDGSPLPASKFDDGRIGWRKLPIRAQETLSRWLIDETGGIQGMEQQPPTGGLRPIPIEKALLFRTETTKGNPQGRSVLRNAFVAWYRKKTIEEIEAIGIERDLAGIPALNAPEGFDLTAEANQAIVEACKDLVTTVKRDEDEGLLIPAGWKFELVTTGGSRQIDTDQVIRRYKLDIATTILADMLLIGQDKVGSYSMLDVKSQIFGTAVDAWLDGIAAVMNSYAIPRLLRLNGISVEDPPKLVHGTTRRMDLEAVTLMLERLSLSGAVIFPDNDLLAALFREAGLPTPAAVEAEKAEGESKGDLPPLGAAYISDGRLLERSLERGSAEALRRFGEEAATAYERTVRKESTEDDRETARKVIASVGIVKLARKLAREWHAHYGRVAERTVTTFEDMLGAEGRSTDVELTAARRAQILRDGGLRVGMLDIEDQLRDSIFKALADAREAKEGWKEAAERIRRYVPAGKFHKAGSAYRSRLIARTETANAQRLTSLAAYEAHPEVAEVELLDGLLTDSDAHCKERSGKKVSFQEAREIADGTHPNCTLQLLPVFGVVAKFDPSERRDGHGRWADGGAGPTAAIERMVEATAEDRARLRIPPAWADVRVASDPDAPLQAIGKDSKGRTQYRYSAAHSERQAAAKFQRIKALSEHLPEIDKALASDGSDAAKALSLIRAMGLRPGSDADTGADVKAFGASTLEARHVKVSGKTVSLDFIGKKGVRIQLSISDPKIAKMISEQKAGKQPGERLFDTNAAKLRDLLHTVAPGFKVKDLRTSLATREASRIVSGMGKPTNTKEWRKMRNEVGDQIASMLGNTRTMALGSYIDPSVFAGWEDVAP